MKFKKGDSLRVKKGTIVEGFEDIDFSGWQGWFSEYLPEEEAEAENELEIEWDSITLKNLPKSFILKNIEEDYDLGSMVFQEEYLEKVPARDKYNDGIKALEKLEEEYLSDDGFGQDDAFYKDLLESKNIEVNAKNIRQYFDYIKEELEMPCILTGGIGAEGSFAWEERFETGHGTKEEYDKIRQNQPSYKDTYEVLDLLEKDIEKFTAIKVKVRRLSDRKQFTLRLEELLPPDKISENYAILAPFVSWYANY